MKLINEVINEEKKFERKYPSLKTGYTSIDKNGDFLYIGKVTLVAGRPAMGKTLFAILILQQKLHLWEMMFATFH